MPETDVVVEDANSPASYLPAGGRQPSPSLGMAQMDPSSEVVRHRMTEMDTVASTAPDHSIPQSYNSVTTGLPPNGSREPSAEQRSVSPSDQALNVRSIAPTPPSAQPAIPSCDHPTVPPSNQSSTPIPASDRSSGVTATGGPTIWRRFQNWITWKFWCLVAVVIALVISIPVGWALRLRDFTVPEPPANTEVGIFRILYNS